MEHRSLFFGTVTVQQCILFVCPKCGPGPPGAHKGTRGGLQQEQRLSLKLLMVTVPSIQSPPVIGLARGHEPIPAIIGQFSGF